ncbi:hypothetical protein ACWM9A_05015 [Acetobacter pasteurianus]
MLSRLSWQILAQDAYTPVGDPEKMTHEMIANVDVSAALGRQVFGNDA